MEHDQDKKPRKVSASQWLAILLALVAAVFILQNLQYTRVELFFWRTSAPLWGVLLVTLGIGYLVGRFSSRRKDKD